MVDADGRIMRHAAVIPHSVVSKKGVSLEGNPPSWKPRYVAEGFGNRKTGRRRVAVAGGSRDSPPFVPKSTVVRRGKLLSRKFAQPGASQSKLGMGMGRIFSAWAGLGSN